MTPPNPQSPPPEDDYPVSAEDCAASEAFFMTQMKEHAITPTPPPTPTPEDRIAGGPGKCRHCGRTLPNVSLHEQFCGTLPELTKFADDQQNLVADLATRLAHKTTERDALMQTTVRYQTRVQELQESLATSEQARREVVDRLTSIEATSQQSQAAAWRMVSALVPDEPDTGRSYAQVVCDTITALRAQLAAADEMAEALKDGLGVIGGARLNFSPKTNPNGIALLDQGVNTISAALTAYQAARTQGGL